MYFEEHKIVFKINYALIAIVCTSLTIIYHYKFNQLPNRFPPSLLWILSPVAYIYAYYLICRIITNKYKISKWITLIDENTSYFLLSSNIIIFEVKFIVKDMKFRLTTCLIFSILIIVFTYWLMILKKWIFKLIKA
jgi:hypothetical protein